jgi:hypothetical protein
MSDRSAKTPALTRVILHLARNPGYPDGDDRQGYVILAPLDVDGHIDLEAWRQRKADCRVWRFKPGEERDADGWLSHRGSHWFFRYDEEDEGDDEPVYRLGDHKLSVGQYLTVHESDGKDLTYRVAQHLPE